MFILCMCLAMREFMHMNAFACEDQKRTSGSRSLSSRKLLLPAVGRWEPSSSKEQHMLSCLPSP